MATAGKNLSSYSKEDLKNTKNLSIGLVVAEWNNNITDALYKGAFNTLVENGVDQKNIISIKVPGSFELIYGAKHLIETHKLNAVIIIGSVIQGETKHFDFICNAVSQGVKDLNIKYNTPVIFCLLTDNTLQQALDRSGGKHGNKGIECAVAALKMATLA
ncbi:MAG: 6,7-dimethyl-8-ribityllumazine synthase [Flavobacteriales bacterium CG03_land_8_20_14_0_80_35_15]|nr:6,7-dimethyl-8-ribityllumazine synthase [Zetaproteobacteria bacterium]NDK17457.1 6,7-dimethyl-8-ribityllumazine synthase [Flavobacteriales bacterium]OIO11308.1 MAG: 6,7-dimethyl-8-ribityllumazine synthase [Flavobacteriaceae bacterium CG1_02_35_72]PIV17741.1 MAG: 6,7-dimethyl-8-ribityllumazine synthase [Flavobacteriales bacterium CG03_land_8_20_14_0_80_35_15]PJA06121.1 MAG: 6,7-dimethyl-8-ribityllumazine synthase [Flavobacteriales bacterium CG_4_10_14_0_2_um_filter_35_18]